MNLELSDEQIFLRDAARDAFSRTNTLEAAREVMDGGERHDAWPTAVEAGWSGLLVSEENGGAGLAAFDAMLVMQEAGRVIERDYELGALADGTGIPGFYQRLGWETWRGPTFVAGPEGPVRTAEDDGGILVLRTPATAGLEPTGPLVCDWRAGDVW